MGSEADNQQQLQTPQDSKNSEQILFEGKMTTDKTISSILFFILPFNKTVVTITSKRVVLKDFAIPIGNIEKIEEKGFFAPVLVSFLRPSGFDFKWGRGLRIKFSQQDPSKPINKSTLAAIESHFPDVGGYVVLFTNPNKLIPVFQKLRPDLKIQSSLIGTFVFFGIIAVILMSLIYLYSRFFPI